MDGEFAELQYSIYQPLAPRSDRVYDGSNERPAAPMDCPSCNLQIQNPGRYCPFCGQDIGFPNVRLAAEPSELDALELRLANARTSAEARGCLDVLEDFGRAVERAQVVIARDISTVQSMLKNDNALYNTFHNQVQSGLRLPEDNSWDKGRDAAESTINPNFYRDINFAALSLNGKGVRSYGEYSVVLKDEFIRARTSFFDENPFTFCRRHKLIVGDAPPPGYRSTWNDRAKLAMAKLHPKLKGGTTQADYPGVLVDQGTSTGDADFIEAHIYGPIHRRAIEKIIGPKPTSKADGIILRSIIKTLRELGATFEEA